MVFSVGSRSLYDVLELEPTASVEALESSYKRLMSEVENAELVLYTIEDDVDFAGQKAELQMAYEVLTNREKRAEYDRYVGGKARNATANMMAAGLQGATRRVDVGEGGASTPRSVRGAASVSMREPLSCADSKSEIGIRAKAAADAVAKSYGLRALAPDIRDEEPAPRSNKVLKELVPLSNTGLKEPVPLSNTVLKEPVPPEEMAAVSGVGVQEQKTPLGEKGTAPIAIRSSEKKPNKLGASVSAVDRISKRFQAFKSIDSKARTYRPDLELLEQIRGTEGFDGSTLMRLRQSSGASIDDIAEITKINKRYLNAIEQNDLNVLPPKVYVQGFIRQFAQALQLSPQEVSASYMELYKSHPNKG